MANDPFAPESKLWELRKDHHTWACELADRSEWGMEGQIFKDGELVISQRFGTEALAREWAELEKQAVEKGDA